MTWDKSIFDGCRIFISGDYNIVEGYEGGFQLNFDGYAIGHSDKLTEIKSFAEEHKRFN